MVSIPCSYSVAPRIPRLPHFAAARFPFFFFPSQFASHRSIASPITAVGDNPSDTDALDRQRGPRTLFRGGFKRQVIKIPSLVLRLSAEEVLRLSAEEVLHRDDSSAVLRKELLRGVNIVVLDVAGQGGGRAYEAACILKSLVGDMACLLIAERVDVAAAVGASGVVLTDQGIPAIVARNMMSKSKSDATFIPLVARDVHNAMSAETATTSDDADFIIISDDGGSWEMMLDKSFIMNVKVPIFFNIQFPGELLATNVVSKVLQSGSSGIVVSLEDLKLFSDDLLEKIFLTKHGSKDVYTDSTKMKIDAFTSAFDSVNGIAGFTKLDDNKMRLLEEENLLLQETISVICKASPMMNEVSLLMDAASHLKDPFLMVIVGEFNSGKSTVINALLGRRYLMEGVIPTTNEITLLCYSESDKLAQCERNPDGHFVYYLSAPILKNINLVDTPGTNVILQRQQRLTEEFVPRADLILFIISSDRPLTESEVSFLRYLQQWKKKVVFVLNKVDLYQNATEVEEATSFVKENTQKLLGTDVRLYPVSARSALEAKLHALSFNSENFEEMLINDPRWISSKFHVLEQFLFSFLDGSTDTGTERLKLKLETPVAIAERLLESSERIVMQQYENECQSLISIKEVSSNTVVYAMKMENESKLWKKRAASLIETAEVQTVKLMEFTLQISNIDLFATYAFKGGKSTSLPSTSTLKNEIINPALADVQRLLWEYSEWLQSCISSERGHCMERLQKHCNKDSDLLDSMQSNKAVLTEQGSGLSIKVTESFSASAASRLFEQEINEIVLGSFGGLGAAGLSASLLTSILPTTLEDLLALAFCSVGGFLAISNFPVRRKEAIKKVRKVADGFSRKVEEAMHEDIRQAIESLNYSVEFISKPYQDAAQQRIDRMLKTQEQLKNTAQKLHDLKVEIQSLHDF